MERNLLDELNEEQRAAAAQIDGPVMIVAGAGSGKTRTLTYRIAHLLKLGVDPFKILALTFTNKAAREMQDRIGKLIGPSSRGLWMGTFHSIFARILRSEAEKLGYPSSFSIYDTDESKNVIKLVLKEMDLDPKEYAPSNVLHRISSAKSSLISAQEYDQNAELKMQDTQAKKPYISKIYLSYQNKLEKSGAMDFDDLLFNINVLFRDFPEVLYKYQKRFSHILVDEYQDTNYAQYLIIKKMAAQHENICVVGDDAQSIYSFRGANIQNILNFQRDYPSVKTYKLEQNYRSSQTIVGLANGVIKNNKEQIFKTIWTENEEGEKAKIIKASNDIEEGQLVGRHIFDLKMNQQVHNKEIAILYRTNNQSRSVEDALRRLNIPYRIHGGLSFYKRKEIKDLLAYFRWVVNIQDEEAFTRCINYPARGIGQTTVDKIRITASENGLSIWDTACKIIESDTNQIASSTKSRMNQIITKIHALHTKVKTSNAFDLAKEIWYASGMPEEYKADKTPEGEARLTNIEELLNAIKDYTEKEQTVFDEETGELSVTDEAPTLDKFLQEISLLTDADTDKTEDEDRVTLMTIHAAKGLEFPYVFVVGLEENLFPSAMSINSRSEIEEERRLFYVATTRAEKKLFLSFALSRMKWGQHTFCEPSRFLEELETEFVDGAELIGNSRGSSFGSSGFGGSGLKQGFGGSGSSGSGFGQSSQKPTSPRGEFVQKTFQRIQPEAPKQAPAISTPANLKKLSTIANNPMSVSESSQSLSVGLAVSHPKFGIGSIISIEGEGANQKVSVEFQGVGIKQLLTKFAKLEVM